MEILKINDLLERFVGGEIFFDELDDYIKTDINIIKKMEELMRNRLPPRNEYKIIVSGEFGLNLINLGGTVDLVVKGGLRKGAKINLDFVKKKIEGYKFAFVDDSFFKGRTRNVIKAEIERLGGEFLGTVVAYDGSIKKDENVHSLYRYYDHH